jgi:uncharacterized membrane protein YgcG
VVNKYRLSILKGSYLYTIFITPRMLVFVWCFAVLGRLLAMAGSITVAAAVEEEEEVHFETSTLWWCFLSIGMLVLLTVLLHTFCNDFLPDALAAYPVSKCGLSVLPSFVILVILQPVMKELYGVDKKSSSDYTLMGDVMDEYLNASINSFLSVAGVLYSLVVAQVFLVTNEKFRRVGELIGHELAACQRVVLCIKSMALSEDDGDSGGSSSGVGVGGGGSSSSGGGAGAGVGGSRRKQEIALKIKAIKVVVWYVNSLLKGWGSTGNRQGEGGSLELLYGVLPIMGKLCDATHHRFNIEVADRIIDSLNNCSDARYHRASVEDQTLPAMLWLLQYLLGAIMFAGVALIASGSEELNVSMCLSTTTLIGLNAIVIADMDMPYLGFIQLSDKPLYTLLNSLLKSQEEDSLSTGLDKRNSILFKANPKALISDKTMHAARNIYNKPKPRTYKRVFAKIFSSNSHKTAASSGGSGSSSGGSSGSSSSDTKLSSSDTFPTTAATPHDTAGAVASGAAAATAATAAAANYAATDATTTTDATTSTATAATAAAANYAATDATTTTTTDATAAGTTTATTDAATTVGTTTTTTTAATTPGTTADTSELNGDGQGNAGEKGSSSSSSSSSSWAGRGGKYEASLKVVDVNERL